MFAPLPLARMKRLLRDAWRGAFRSGRSPYNSSRPSSPPSSRPSSRPVYLTLPREGCEQADDIPTWLQPKSMSMSNSPKKEMNRQNPKQPTGKQTETQAIHSRSAQGVHINCLRHINVVAQLAATKYLGRLSEVDLASRWCCGHCERA